LTNILSKVFSFLFVLFGLLSGAYALRRWKSIRGKSPLSSPTFYDNSMMRETLISYTVPFISKEEHRNSDKMTRKRSEEKCVKDENWGHAYVYHD